MRQLAIVREGLLRFSIALDRLQSLTACVHNPVKSIEMVEIEVVLFTGCTTLDREVILKSHGSERSPIRTTGFKAIAVSRDSTIKSSFQSQIQAIDQYG